MGPSSLRSCSRVLVCQILIVKKGRKVNILGWRHRYAGKTKLILKSSTSFTEKWIACEYSCLSSQPTNTLAYGKTVVCKFSSHSQLTRRQIEQPQDTFSKLSKSSLTYHKFVQRVCLFVSSWFEIHHMICLLFIQHRCCGKGFQLVVRRLRRKSNRNTFGYEN